MSKELNEINEKIASSANKDWFLNYELTISSNQTGFSQRIKGVPTLFEFLSRQIIGFESIENLPQEFKDLKVHFERFRTIIFNLVIDDNANRHTWDNKLQWLSNNSGVIFSYNSPEFLFLIETFQVRQQYYPGAYEFLTGTTSHATIKEHLAGYILAYEFVSKDFSILTERKNAEEKSTETIRRTFQKKLSEAENEVAQYIESSNKKFTEYATEIDKIKAQKEQYFNDWFEDAQISFRGFDDNAQKKIKEYEALYREKLKLEAPAKYWSDRAIKLRKEGIGWLWALIACIVIAVIILVGVLAKIADGTIMELFNNAGIAIKWSITLITLISFLAYALKIFSKLTFSSYHLARDAEEREQLTYVYLALQKEKGIDQTERHLIMQSLFSRADSGLLKDDAAPTMPGGILDKIVTKG